MTPPPYLTGPTMDRRKFLQSAALVAAIAGVDACSKTTHKSNTATSGGTPKPGGIAILGQVPELAFKSVIATQTNASFSYSRLVFNTLAEYAIGTGTLTAMPALAESWSTSADGKAITFKLRKGVTFHTGRPFTADDVVFAVQTTLKPASSSQMVSAASNIADMSVVDPQTITLKLAEPRDNMFDLFCLMNIVDKETYADLVTGKNFVGTGPFKFKSYTPGDSLQLTKNPSYWRSGRPYLDGVTVRIIPQAQALLAALQSGGVHLALDLAPRDVAGLIKQGYPNIAMANQDAFYYLGCNVKVEPLGSKTVRQAISYAIDRNRIAAEVLSGLGNATSTPWAKTSPAYDQSKANHYNFDTAKAKQMLSGAGAAGAAVSITVSNGVQAYSDIAQIVQFNLKAAGLNATINSVQAADFLPHLVGGTIPGLWVNSHGFTDLQPGTLVTAAFPYNAAKNSSNFVDAAFQQLAKNALTAPASQSAAVNAQLTDLMLDQQFAIDLVGGYHMLTLGKKLSGTAYTRFDAVNLDDAYLS